MDMMKVFLTVCVYYFLLLLRYGRMAATRTVATHSAPYSIRSEWVPVGMKGRVTSDNEEYSTETVMIRFYLCMLLHRERADYWYAHR